MTIVQRTPSLGVGIRMQRLPGGSGGSAAAPAPPPVPPTGAKVALMVGYREVDGIDVRVGWRQRVYFPEFEDWRLVDGVIEIQPEEVGPGIFRAVVVGESPGAPIAWGYSLTVPSVTPGMNDSWEGVDIVREDGTLGITVHPGDYAGEGYVEAQLVCTAVVAGVEIGSVTLRPCFHLDARLDAEEGV